jgi:hypothetical protein
MYFMTFALTRFSVMVDWRSRSASPDTTGDNNVHSAVVRFAMISPSLGRPAVRRGLNIADVHDISRRHELFEFVSLR